MFASLSDLKTHLNYPAAKISDDLELQLMLDAATEVVTDLVGDFSGAAVSDVFSVHAGTVLLDQVPPSSVTVTDSAGGSVTGYTVRPTARLLTGVTAEGYVTVTYAVAGQLVPASLKLATLIIAGHLWETQRGTSPSQLGLQQADDTVFVPGRGFAIPDRARELLAPFVTTAGQIA